MAPVTPARTLSPDSEPALLAPQRAARRGSLAVASTVILGRPHVGLCDAPEELNELLANPGMKAKLAEAEESGDAYLWRFTGRLLFRPSQPSRLFSMKQSWRRAGKPMPPTGGDCAA